MPAIPPVEPLQENAAGGDHRRPATPYGIITRGSERFQRSRITSTTRWPRSTAPPADFADYERKSQAMAYDAERAMFEAYSRNKYGSTGVIQWMLNNAWPSLIWHLYDYYLQPAGGYFGAKKACEPLHVQYSYDDRSVVVVNSTYVDVSGLSVTAKLLRLATARSILCDRAG